jgi:hypothetical protein
VTVPVCWENPAAATQLRRDWTRSAVAASWQRATRVVFSEWDGCKKGEKGLRIRIQDTRPAFPGGKTINGVVDGGSMNLTWSAFGPPGCQGTPAAVQHCIKAVAAHEFGHVLGFYHEEERADYTEPPGTPPNDPCEEQSADNSSPQLLGAYDVESVMSYCGQPGGDPTTWTEALSPNDIVAVQQIYGRHIPGSIVSPGGHCLSAHAASTHIEDAFLWGCDEALDDQEWRFVLSKSKLRLGSDRCLQATGTQTRVVLGYCPEDVTGQRWKLTETGIAGWGGLCLDLRGGSQNSGTPAQMWTCGALKSANQRWTVTTNGEIRYRSSSNCLTVPATGDAYLSPCAKPDLQRFALAASGQLRLKNAPTQCLDVRG